MDTDTMLCNFPPPALSCEICPFLPHQDLENKTQAYCFIYLTFNHQPPQMIMINAISDLQKQLSTFRDANEKRRIRFAVTGFTSNFIFEGKTPQPLRRDDYNLVEKFTLALNDPR